MNKIIQNDTKETLIIGSIVVHRCMKGKKGVKNTLIHQMVDYKTVLKFLISNRKTIMRCLDRCNRIKLRGIGYADI